MTQVATATTTLTRVRLTLPPGSRIRPGSPFFNGMSAEVVGPDPDSEQHMIVRVDGAQLKWPKSHVHEA